METRQQQQQQQHYTSYRRVFHGANISHSKQQLSSQRSLTEQNDQKMEYLPRKEDVTSNHRSNVLSLRGQEYEKKPTAQHQQLALPQHHQQLPQPKHQHHQQLPPQQLPTPQPQHQSQPDVVPHSGRHARAANRRVGLPMLETTGDVIDEDVGDTEQNKLPLGWNWAMWWTYEGISGREVIVVAP